MRLHFGGADPHSLRKNHSTTVPILIGLAAVVGIAAYGCHSNQPNAPQSVSPAAATETSAASVTDAGSATMPPAGAAPAPDPGGASVQTVSSTAGSGANAQSSNSGPVRMVRFVTVQGDVNWRPDDHASWSQAVTNLPVRQGCEISTPGNSRAEVQFDDGSRLQIANGAVVTLTTLYSDADGEYSELTLKDGTICIWPRNEHSVYQVDTPCGSVDATGPGRCRIDASHGVQVADQAGKCAVRDKQGEQTLVAGNYVDLPNDEAPYNVQSLPPHDSFDNWTAQDYAQDQRYQNSATYQDLPRNVAIASDNLDDYGDWRTDPKYGRIWHPHIHEAGWRPYYHGHWVWVDPYGWTWVDNEPWGWAPSHYGTWVDESDGWCWAPGPVNQYWSPAVVDFYETPTAVAWCPLAPTEVVYPPALSIGFHSGNWSLFFSIGGAAVYYPGAGGFCEPHPWGSGYVNNYTVVNNVTTVNNFYNSPRFNRNSYVTNTAFVPYNARYAAGATLASVSTFGGRGSFQPLARGSRTAFTGGRFIGAPTRGASPVAGPPAVRPTAIAMTATRTIRTGDPVPHAVLTRPVFRPTGQPGNPAAVQQARVVATRTATSGGPRFIASTTPGRVPAIGTRTPQTPGPAATTVPGARVPGGVTPRPPTMTGLTPQQRAMQARGALGAPGGQPIRPGVRPTSPSVATGQRPNTPSPQRPGSFGPPQRPTPSAPPRVAAGRPGTAPQPHVGAPERPNTRIVPPVTHPTPERPAPRTGSNAPAIHGPIHQPQTQIQHNAPAPPPHHTTVPQPQPQVRHTAPPAPQRHAIEQPRPPVRQYQPPVRQPQPPVRQPQPPVRQQAPPHPAPAQHSAPLPQGHAPSGGNPEKDREHK